jgi:hypothetical protein
MYQLAVSAGLMTEEDASKEFLDQATGTLPSTLREQNQAAEALRNLPQQYKCHPRIKTALSTALTRKTLSGREQVKFLREF